VLYEKLDENLNSFVLVGIFLLLYFMNFPIGTDGNFSSDTAIPVIMANQKISPFHLFYFGQDRFGGWLFILQSFFSATLGFRWLAEYSYLSNIFILCCSLVSLGRADKTLSKVLPFSILFCTWLSTCIRSSFFTIEQVYVLQFATFFFAWCSIILYLKAKNVKHRVMLLGLFFISSFFAIWSSPLSLIFISPIILLEPLRKSESICNKEKIIDILLLFAVLGLSFICYEFMRNFYLSYVSSTYAFELQNHPFGVSTLLEFDLANCVENFRKSMVLIFNDAPYTGFFLYTFVISYVVGGLGLKIIGKFDLVDRNKYFLVLELLLAGFIAQFFITILAWVKINGFHHRYFVPPILLYYIASVVVINEYADILFSNLGARFFSNMKEKIDFKKLVVAVFILWIAIFNFGKMKSSYKRFSQLKDASEKLTKNSEKVILFGNYWDTYKWQGLNPKIIAISLDYVRIPWQYKLIGKFEKYFLVRESKETEYSLLNHSFVSTGKEIRFEEKTFKELRLK